MRPIHVATNTAGSPITVPAGPFTLGITPNGKTLFVTGNPNLFASIRISDNVPETPIVVGQAPSAFALAVID